MPSFSRESSRRSGLSSGWGDSNESSADEFSRKASKKISRGAVSTKSSHWGDTDESSDDSKVRRIYSQNPSRQPSKLSSWGDSGTSSDSDAPAYGGAVKPKPISARASAREKSTLSRASKWSDEESDEEEDHLSKKSKSKKISSVSKWSDDESEASIKSPQLSKKSPESSKKEPEPARKSLDELMSKISYGESRNEPSRKTSNMSKRPVSLRAPDKAPPKSPAKANPESEERRETSIKKIEKFLEKKPVPPTPKSESSNDSDKEPFVLDSTNSEKKQESSEDNQSRSSRVKGSRLSKISRISQWSDEDSEKEEPPKSDLKDETGKLPKRVKEISSSGLSRKNAIRASGRSSSRISSKANEKYELSDLMKFSASNSSSSKFELKEEKSEIRPKTRAQIQPELSTASKWSDNDDSSDTEVEMDNQRLSEISKTETNIPINQENDVKSSKKSFVPKSNQASALSEWSDHESDKNKIREKKISSLSKWSDNESDKHESRRSKISKADISALSKWSVNESEKDKPKSKISMAQLSSLSKWSDNESDKNEPRRSKICKAEVSALSKWSDNESEQDESARKSKISKAKLSSISKWSDNESEKNESRRSKVSRAGISALSKWSDNESDKNESLGKSRISKAQVSSLSKWSDNESDKNESRRSKVSRAEISALSKWSDNESEKDEPVRKSRISKAEVSPLSKWSDNESDKQEIEIKEEKPSTPDWRKKINIDDYFAVFNRMREEKNAQPINSSSLQKESETKEEREISALSAWTDNKSVNRSNISKWTDNESDDDNEKTPKNISLARALDVRSKSSKWSDNQSEIRSALSKWSDQESDNENQVNKEPEIEENAGQKAPSRVTSIETRASSKWGTQRGSSVYSSHTEADSANVSSLSKWSDNQSEKPEVSNQSAWTDVLSDPEKTPTNAAQERIAPGRMNKLSSIDSNSNQNRANPFMNPFDATVAHKESPPPAIPKSAVPMSSGTDWTDTEAKLTKEEEAIPAKYLMTTDNIESDPDDYVKQFNSKAINADTDFGPINDDTSLIDVDMELPPKQMVEIVPKKKGLCGASCSGKSNKSVWESIKSATKICKK